MADPVFEETSADPSRSDGPQEEGNIYLFFFGGILLGALLAAACGLDLFSSDKAQIEYIKRLEAKVESLEKKVKKIHSDGVPVDQKKVKTSLRTPDSSTLLKLLDQSKWSEFSEGVESLLVVGESGYDHLLDVIKKGIQGKFDSFNKSAALFPLLKVIAANEVELAEFISYALVSKRFREDTQIKEWVLRWGSWFIAGSKEKYGPCRGALHQSLDRHLKTGEAGIWVVLNGLELLEGEIPAGSIRRLLWQPDREGVHGYLLKRLEYRGDAEAVRVLKKYIQSHIDRGDWKITLALESLSRIRRVDAQNALKEFMSSRDPEVGDTANLAYFSAKRDQNSGFDVLIAFLNSDRSRVVKRRVLTMVFQKSPELFQYLCKDPAAVKDNELKKMLKSASLPLPASFSEKN